MGRAPASSDVEALRSAGDDSSGPPDLLPGEDTGDHEEDEADQQGPGDALEHGADAEHERRDDEDHEKDGYLLPLPR